LKGEDMPKKRPVWKHELEGVADNPEYPEIMLSSIKKELKKDRPDTNYIKSKLHSLDDFIGDIDLARERGIKGVLYWQLPSQKKTKKKPAFGSVAWQTQQAKKVKAKLRKGKKLTGADKAFVTTQLIHNYGISQKQVEKQFGDIVGHRKVRKVH
jgi:hypothetical protein